MAKLALSILSADFSKLASDVKLIEKGNGNLIHVDVMDGHFVKNISFGSTVMKSLLGKTKLPFDVHLMIENPERYIKDFVTDNTEYITVHYEACNNLKEIIDLIKKENILVGVSINPDTPVDVLNDFLEYIDLVLVMSVYPGFSGQKMIESTLEKIELLSDLREKNNYSFEIEIDGGITIDNVMLPIEKGADIIVAGSSVFGAEDPLKATEEFCKKIY